MNPFLNHLLNRKYLERIMKGEEERKKNSCSVAFILWDTLGSFVQLVRETLKRRGVYPNAATALTIFIHQRRAANTHTQHWRLVRSL